LNGWIAIILFLVISIGLWAYMQSELNKVWRAEGDALPGQPAPPAVEEGMPSRLPEQPQQAPPDPGPPPER
jgi:hypothetical protein